MVAAAEVVGAALEGAALLGWSGLASRPHPLAAAVTLLP